MKSNTDHDDCHFGVRGFITAFLSGLVNSFLTTRVRLYLFIIPTRTRKQSGDESPQSKMDSDALVAEVKKLRGKSKPLTATALKALRDEDAHTLVPARVLATEALTLERQLSDLVNAAYGLTPAEVQLMWDTAPPRMPIASPTKRLNELGDALKARFKLTDTTGLSVSEIPSELVNICRVGFNPRQMSYRVG